MRAACWSGEGTIDRHLMTSESYFKVICYDGHSNESRNHTLTKFHFHPLNRINNNSMYDWMNDVSFPCLDLQKDVIRESSSANLINEWSSRSHLVRSTRAWSIHPSIHPFVWSICRIRDTGRGRLLPLLGQTVSLTQWDELVCFAHSKPPSSRAWSAESIAWSIISLSLSLSLPLTLYIQLLLVINLLHQQLLYELQH